MPVFPMVVRQADNLLLPVLVPGFEFDYHFDYFDFDFDYLKTYEKDYDGRWSKDCRPLGRPSTLFCGFSQKGVVDKARNIDHQKKASNPPTRSKKYPIKVLHAYFR